LERLDQVSGGVSTPRKEILGMGKNFFIFFIGGLFEYRRNRRSYLKEMDVRGKAS
jgi:hypothetical protein